MTSLKKHSPAILLLLGCAALAALLIIDSPLAMQGAREGLILSGQVVIPSMYPFFVIANLYVQTCVMPPSLEGGGRRGVRGKQSGVVLLGLLGGYPLGAKAAAMLMERGAITQAQAQKLQLFCLNAGPAYLIGAIGTGLLGNRRAGVMLFVSLALASLVIGLCTRFISIESPGPSINPQKPIQPSSFDQKILASVTQSTAAIITICAWVVLFSALIALLHRLPMRAWGAIPALNVFLEVSSGAVAVIRSNMPLPVLCAALGWGGLSVHCQVLGDLKKTALPLRLFWASRLLHSGLAAAICALLVRWFPVNMPVAAAAMGGPSSPIRLWAVSAPAAVALLIFCAFIILELDLNRKIC
jgi:hypothetical protein